MPLLVELRFPTVFVFGLKKITHKAPLSHTRNFLGILRALIQANLKNWLNEFLGNHKIHNPVKLYIQENLKHASTEFLGNHQIRTPVKIYFLRSLGSRVLGV